ncbi:DNA-directed RNA polymerase subunit beta' [Spiroplasma helicoides]|uniref:DNA-directed RNA polymerase subunit beta' n=1 Tax=Spiroplasma helicoides TaxID=216938 RepID=A0A1B3SJA0_9MOLU|nr:DNA-directed RNA polymerase subunit beta' [Spiroplasma helicoides]AOG60011.1 DNA-directed RNA polymerase subunit beta' [Spiroplasma helicoides]
MGINKRMIKIELASPDVIRSWSRGEVTKPETINYKTLKTEKEGLFDERIFGPTKNYECSCGKYKKVKNKGKVCERCNVEITETIVRRERMGHIELEEPVTHIWMLKVVPSRIASILDLKTKEVEEVVYFVSHVVLDAGGSRHLERGQVLDLGNAKASLKTREKLLKTLEDIKADLDEETRDWRRADNLITQLKSQTPFSMDEAATFMSRLIGAKFGIGASAIEELLKGIDLDKEITKLKDKLKENKGSTEQNKMMKRLEVLDSLKKSQARPEWMVLHVIPVIPPDIRPIIQLDGGRFTTSEINDLYRRIIIRNERLKKVKSMGAPSIIVNNEKRMLQEAVDALLDNERKPRPVTGKDKRALKSLTSILKGKQGRFRQNLLGKRVDYSGRSVIAIGPDLKMYQAGIPRDMAITLFKPFVIRRLQERDFAENVKVAEKMILANDTKVWDVLEEVIKDRPVLLNRAPTLHRLGIQAFEPKLVKGKAIRLHPLVTTAFNADFDGDQMAVHLPISDEAVAEARALMLGSSAILGPKDGKPIVTPTQDMILGNYYISTEEKETEANGIKGQGTLFSSCEEAKIAYENDVVSLNAIVAIPVNVLHNKMFKPEHQDKYLITTVGKILFNEMFNEEFPWIINSNILNAESEVEKFLVDSNTNVREYIEKDYEIQQPIKKKELSLIIERYFKTYGAQKTAQMLDNMKNLGFKFSSKSGTTISAADVVAFEEKNEEFKIADEKVSQINEYYEQGMLTKSEKKRRVIAIWSQVKDKIQSKLESVLKRDLKNPVFVMADSGARGNVSNFTQLVGMRGLMNDPKGDIKEIPIKSSFREGLTVSEYFISTHGARKGMADVALKTADSGYLTRRLVDISQEIIVTQEDCNASKGFNVYEIIDTKHNNTIVPLRDRLVGRYSFEDVEDLKGNIIVPKNTLFTAALADDVITAGVTDVKIRTVLTCETNRGVCRKCYGINLATGNEVSLGEPVGVVAAQSIGEPGTQLTMRTFHTGGVAGGADITQGLPRIKELLDVTTPKGSIAIISQIDGVVTEVKEDGIITIVVKSENDERKYKSQYGAISRVQVGDKVKRGKKLTEGAINIKELLEVARVEDVQNYILKEVQKVYRLQGIEISDKYIEIIIKQMLNKVKIIDSGETSLLPGEIISEKTFKEEVLQAILENRKPPLAKYVIFGIKKAPLESDSWLSSASFQDTARVLVKAVIKGKVDKLEGLKENIMLGNLIPAGTGLTGSEDIIKKGKEVLKLEY